MFRGKFITFEGLDGAGKSTHIAFATELLRGKGREVIVTREPGGTDIGEALRELLLNRAMHVDTETLLMFAARREHLARVIEPALERGAWVICDRFTDATRAYQGGGRGVDAGRIEILADWVHPATRPDLTLLFDLSPDVARRRLDASRTLDRFEAEQAAFHERVRETYRNLARAEPDRFVVLAADQPVDNIDKALEEIFSNI